MEIHVKYSFHKKISFKIIHFLLSEKIRHKKHPKAEDNEFLSDEKDPRYFLIGLPNCILEVLHGFYKSKRYRGINFCIQVGGLPKWGVSAHGRCLPRGVSTWGVSARGVCPGSLCHTPTQCMLGYKPPAQCMLGYTPLPSAGRDPPLVDRILDTRLWKRYLSATTVADGKKWDSSSGSSLSFPTALPITPQSQLCLWWALNFTYSMHHCFCLICLIHLIRRKCLNFEKN